MKKFNLMQVVPSLESGGAEQGTIDVANYLASMELNSFIISNGGSMLMQLNKQKVHHINLPLISKNILTMLNMLGIRLQMIQSSN